MKTDVNTLLCQKYSNYTEASTTKLIQKLETLKKKNLNLKEKLKNLPITYKQDYLILKENLPVLKQKLKEKQLQELKKLILIYKKDYQKLLQIKLTMIEFHKSKEILKEQKTIMKKLIIDLEKSKEKLNSLKQILDQEEMLLSRLHQKAKLNGLEIAG